MKDKKFSAIVTAVGMYVPEKVYDNAYMESIVDTNDEWITARTGIKERRILENGATSDLAANAALDLINAHNIWVKDWTVLITIIAWAVTIKGFLLVASPNLLFSCSSKLKFTKNWGFLIIALGLLFGYFGFVA